MQEEVCRAIVKAFDVCQGDEFGARESRPPLPPMRGGSSPALRRDLSGKWETPAGKAHVPARSFVQSPDAPQPAVRPAPAEADPTPDRPPAVPPTTGSAPICAALPRRHRPARAAPSAGIRGPDPSAMPDPPDARLQAG
ncbi:hypothetical protein GCM10007886_25230 [Methylobacterium gregans]|nr:hypothetical protein GCM10007886_25230 [Methylobacterium gregans]